MKCFGTNKTWQEDLEDFKTTYDPVNDMDVVLIEKNALIMMINQAIDEALAIHANFTGV